MSRAYQLHAELAEQNHIKDCSLGYVFMNEYFSSSK